jgi:ABC-type Fe3+/spermidine/putrescine transport system ATPase subunit
MKLKVESSGTGQMEGSQLVSIRPHRIEIHPEGARIDGADGLNIFDGEVTRGYFLGNAADYLVKIPHLDEPLRVEADPENFYPAGTKVRLVIKPKSVIPVRASEG